MDPLTVAVASGKGGTGKTTFAVNLALAASQPVSLLDCDVEEPDCAIFLRPASVLERKTVGIPIPVVDEARCTGCGECGRFCQYHAIVSPGKSPLVFPDLCHGCGGCTRVCPTGAISEVEHAIGTVEISVCGSIRLVQGRLSVGHPMSPPLIRAVKRTGGRRGLTVIDCPPGTSCPVIAALRASDFVVLVTEPTPFGLHDLTLAVETVRLMDLSFAVVINRADAGDGRVAEFCRQQEIRVLLELPEDRRLAEAYARGLAAVEAIGEYRQVFVRLWKDIEQQAQLRRAAKGAVHADL